MSTGEHPSSPLTTSGDTSPTGSAASPAVSFDDIVASRKDWIESVLRPWCRSASRKELQKAAAEWGDIAGRVDPDATLWSWAWERFPAISHAEISGVNETHEVTVTLNDARLMTGFPDSRQSLRGLLVLVGRDESNQPVEHGPFSLDEVQSVERTELA